MSESTIFLIDIIILLLFSFLIAYLHLKITEKIHLLSTQKLVRLFEIMISIQGLITGIPVMTLAAIAVKLSSSGPVFHKQEYCSAYGKKFKARKFRTMVKDADKLEHQLHDRNLLQPPGFYVKDDPRLTPVGRILRKTGLDELPLLINLLKGDISLVGPKLITPKENKAWKLYTKTTSVKPGFIDIGYRYRYTQLHFCTFSFSSPYIYTLKKQIVIDNVKRLAKDRLYIKHPSKNVYVSVFMYFFRIQPTRVLSKIEPEVIRK